MNKKKAIVSVLVSSLAIGMLAGCSPAEPKDNSTIVIEKPENEVAEIVDAPRGANVELSPELLTDRLVALPGDDVMPTLDNLGVTANDLPPGFVVDPAQTFAQSRSENPVNIFLLIEKGTVPDAAAAQEWARNFYTNENGWFVAQNRVGEMRVNNSETVFTGIKPFNDFSANSVILTIKDTGEVEYAVSVDFFDSYEAMVEGYSQ